MDDYLSKPVAREHLENTLRRWLNTPSRLRRTSPQSAQTTDSASVEAVSAPAEAISADAAPAEFAHAELAAAEIAPVVVAPTHSVHVEAAPAVAAAPVVAMASTATAAPTHAMPAHTVRRPALDSEVIEELWSAMGDAFKELVDVFLDDAPGHIAKLEAAAVLEDIASMAGPAHALKSSSANLGAMQVSAAARHIEHGSRDGTLHNAVAAVTVLSREFHRAEIELRVLLH